MKKLLTEISRLGIKANNNELSFTEAQKETQWLGNTPATLSAIEAVEKRLNVRLPHDYKSFLQVTDGFAAPTTIDASFNRVQDIDYLTNVNALLIRIWNETPGSEIGPGLAKSILVAGRQEEQYFLLVPPDNDNDTWHYWKYANWLPGIMEYENMEAYFNKVLDFIKESGSH